MRKIFFLLFFCFSLSSFSQNDVEPIIKNFFTVFEKSGIEKALIDLYSTNPWNESSKASINDLVNRFSPITKELVGEYCGYDLLEKRTAGTSLVLCSYLIKYDRQGFRFTFVFYKPRDKWQVNNFLFDDKVMDELENSSSIGK